MRPFHRDRDPSRELDPADVVVAQRSSQARDREAGATHDAGTIGPVGTFGHDRCPLHVHENRRHGRQHYRSPLRDDRLFADHLVPDDLGPAELEQVVLMKR